MLQQQAAGTLPTTTLSPRLTCGASLREAGAPSGTGGRFVQHAALLSRTCMPHTLDKGEGVQAAARPSGMSGPRHQSRMLLIVTGGMSLIGTGGVRH